MRPKLTYANVMATMAVFIALGGSAYAATQLKKNSVGTKQLKKNAVVAAKIKNGAVTAAKLGNDAVTSSKIADASVTAAKVSDGSLTGAKVADGSLTGKQVNASTLGVVPVADRANSLPPQEAWHVVGTPGEPPFESGWVNITIPKTTTQTIAFYKDHEGVVHLRGDAQDGGGSRIFNLPPGSRPPENKTISQLAECQCSGEDIGRVAVVGTAAEPGASGAVLAPIIAKVISIDGISFRAES